MSRVCSVRYQYARYRHGCRTELAEVSGTGIDVPRLPKCPVPVLMLHWITVALNLPKCPAPVWKSVPVPLVPVSVSYRTYPSVRYQYPCGTELTEVSGTGIDVMPNLPKCPVPVYWCTELAEVSGTGIDVLVPAPVPALVPTWVHVPAVYVQSIPGISRRYPLT